VQEQAEEGKLNLKLTFCTLEQVCLYLVVRDEMTSHEYKRKFYNGIYR